MAAATRSDAHDGCERAVDHRHRRNGRGERRGLFSFKLSKVWPIAAPTRSPRIAMLSTLPRGAAAG